MMVVMESVLLLLFKPAAYRPTEFFGITHGN